MNKKVELPVTIYFYPLLNDVLIDNVDSSELFRAEKDDEDALLYVHIPYCKSHCKFCPFNTKVCSKDSEIDKYIDALITEIELLPEGLTGLKIGSFYYGGGSPSILSIKNIDRLHKAIEKKFDISKAEITFEGELRTLADEEKLDYLKSINVSRLSFGFQTFDDEIRKNFNIQFTSEEALKLVYKIVSKNLFKINVDMMYGLPNQDIGHLKNDIARLSSMPIQSIDYYRLHPYSLPESMKGAWIDKANENKSSFVKLIIESLDEKGFKNVCDQVFSKEGLSKYSQLMWGKENRMIGLGASSRGFSNGYSYMNCSTIDRYMKAINNKKMPIEKISDKRNSAERQRVFAPKFFEIPKGYIVNADTRYEDVISKWLERGWIEDVEEKYIVTEKGKLYIDGMVIEGMPEPQYNLANGIENKISTIKILRTGRF